MMRLASIAVLSLSLMGSSVFAQLSLHKDRVIARASDYFRDGKEALEQNKIPLARQKFDMAVDEILSSGYDIRADSQLNAFYEELIERIFQMEVPGRIPPQSPRPDPSPTPPIIGFKEQKSEPANDRLAVPPAKPKESDIVIQGFWLGMKLEDADIPEGTPLDRKSLTDDDIKIGLKKYDLSRYDLQRRGLNTTTNGTILVSLTFLDNVLHGISVGYDDTVAFSDMNDFARTISRSLKLPFTWKFTGGKESIQMATLNYNHFDFVLLFGGRVRSLLVFSDDLDQTTSRRRREEIERKRREFKP